MVKSDLIQLLFCEKYLLGFQINEMKYLILKKSFGWFKPKQFLARTVIEIYLETTDFMNNSYSFGILKNMIRFEKNHQKFHFKENYNEILTLVIKTEKKT